MDETGSRLPPKIIIKIQRLKKAQGLPLPSYMTDGAAGMDLYAAVRHTLAIRPGQRCLIPTGIKIALPVGFEAQIRPRSGLAIKYGVTILNAPGTIDADYRGEIKVILINLGEEIYLVRRGERIAQMVVQNIPQTVFAECDELPCTDRGEGGFGHTM